MINLAVLVHSLRCSLLRAESRFLQAAGLGPTPQLAPALAVNGPSLLPQTDQEHEPEEEPTLLDSILWMAAPKKRRSIEVNRTRRRSEAKLIKLKMNIEQCPECGHLKEKHVLCGYCYVKVAHETHLIREKIKEMEGGPLRAPTVETVILYDGETPHEQDKDKRIVERPRKRPNWFSN
ncbi:large ribosomal subunit protein bL32m [Austrofundulus limnaeus]|uniref:Large ribosomal subunit protein bL32m n=1 Tax=Austrofundulus limnaeus TaxID=52670 RepID=A0A2I4CI16_AUSLI|nr:PREDICTED: 39S ribosomal protein L32, mitochondrial [Austrofundulus limnaeus]